MTYLSTKTYNHEVGLSVCFRQHKATHSHCRHLHGYALAIRIEFETTELDHNNWVIDFGGLKTVKDWLVKTFDHKLLVAKDDPRRSILVHLDDYDLAEVMLVENTGCEAFAKLVYDFVSTWLKHEGHYPRVRVRSVEVKEHGANSAIYLQEL